LPKDRARERYEFGIKTGPSQYAKLTNLVVEKTGFSGMTKWDLVKCLVLVDQNISQWKSYLDNNLIMNVYLIDAPIV